MSNLIAPPIAAMPTSGIPTDQRAEAGSESGASGFASMVADAGQTQSGGEAGKAATEGKTASEARSDKATTLTDGTASPTTDTDAEAAKGLPGDAAGRQGVATLVSSGDAAPLLTDTEQSPVTDTLDPEAALTASADSDELLSQLAALDRAKRQMDGAEPVDALPLEPTAEEAEALLPTKAGEADTALVPDALPGQVTADTSPADQAEPDEVAPLFAVTPTAEPLTGQDKAVETAPTGLATAAHTLSNTGATLAAANGASTPASGAAVQPDAGTGPAVALSASVEMKAAGEGTLPGTASASSSPVAGQAGTGQTAPTLSFSQMLQSSTASPVADAEGDSALDGLDGLDGDGHRPLHTDSAHRQAVRQPAQAEPAMLRQPVAAERLAPELRERLAVMINSERLTAELRLDPPELGALQVRIQMNGDQAQVQIQTQNAQARDLLEQALPRLREMLQGQGIQLADANISQQQSGGQSGSGGHTGGTGGEMAPQEEGVAHQIGNRNAEGGIDFYA